MANHLNCSPEYWEYKSMETMTSVVKQKLAVYNIQIQSTDEKQTLDITVNKLDKPALTVKIPENPRKSQNQDAERNISAFIRTEI